MSVWKLILYTVIVAAFLIYFHNDLGNAGWILIIFWFLLYLLPTVIIHANYFLRTKNNSFVIVENQITITYGDSTKVIDFSNIEKIELHMSANEIQQSGLRHFPFEGYHFARFFLKDDENFTITSLYSNNLNLLIKNNIKNVKIEIIEVFYPLINL